MKISPLPQGGTAGVDLTGSTGRGLSTAKLETIKQLAQGISVKPSDTPVDSQVEELERQAAKQDIKRIKMRTNHTVNRYGDQIVEEQEPAAQEPAQAEPESTTADTSDVTPVVEDTKPLSPQFAELARQRRALQVKEREIADREKALASQSTPNKDVEELTARLKSQPLSVLQEYGVTYDQLTEAILSGQSANPEILALKQEIKALKEGVDKNLSERDAQAEQQVLAEIERDVKRRATSDSNFELIRIKGAESDVKELIHRTFKESGEILDTEEAMQLIEAELEREALEIANTNKVRSKLTPATPPQQQPPKQQFRTLTNRDTARPVTDRRARAIAAALGQLGK